jgi:hypothetical protein
MNAIEQNNRETKLIKLTTSTKNNADHQHVIITDAEIESFNYGTPQIMENLKVLCCGWGWPNFLWMGKINDHAKTLMIESMPSKGKSVLLLFTRK